MVRRARGVVDVDRADARVPRVLGRAVLARLVHVAERGAVAADVDLLADEVVALVVGVVGVELDGRREDVRGGLVEAAGLAAVDQAGRVGGDAVRHLVGGHVDGGERLGVGGAVAVGHAEAGVLPEGVHVGVAVVDAGVRADAVTADAGAAVHVLVVVPGERGAVVGVGARRLLVGGEAVAPRVRGVGEQRPGARGAAVEVVRLVVAAAGVGQRVRGRGAERHLAAVLRVADAGLDGLPLVELRAGRGVRDDVQLVRGAVVLEAADDGLVREDGGAALGHPHDLARGAVGGGLLRAVRGGEAEGLLLGGGRGDVGAEVDVLQLGAAGLGDPGGGAGLGLGDDQVAAEDREARVGALVARVGGAVAVLDHVADDQLLLGAEPQLLGGLGLVGVGGLDQRGALGGGEVGGELARVGLAGGLRLGGGREGVGRGGAGLDADGDHGGGGDERAGRGGAAAGRGSHANSFCEGGTGPMGGRAGRSKQSGDTRAGDAANAVAMSRGRDLQLPAVPVRSASTTWPEVVRCAYGRVR